MGRACAALDSVHFGVGKSCFQLKLAAEMQYAQYRAKAITMLHVADVIDRRTYDLLASHAVQNVTNILVINPAAPKSRMNHHIGDPAQ